MTSVELDKVENTCVSLKDWAEANVGGLIALEPIFGSYGPVDDSNVGKLYDEAFSKFKPIVVLGKRKYSSKVQNTAQNKEELCADAVLFKTKFKCFMDAFIEHCSDLRYSSGVDDRCLVKSGEG